MPTYRVMAIIGGFVAACLCVTLLAAPGLIFWLFALEPSETGAVMGRRAAMLFLGIGTLLILSRDAAVSALRDAIALSIAILMVGLAALGLVEFLRGAVGAGIFLAIGAEVLIAAGFLRTRGLA